MAPFPAEAFSTSSLRRDRAGRDLAEMMAAAVGAVDPHRCVHQHVQRDGDALVVDGETIPLPRGGRVLVAGGGKAGAAMTQALVEILGERIDDGVVVVKSQGEHRERLGPVRLAVGAHPVPDHSSVDAAREVLSLVASATADDLVICPISGGASALLCAPVQGVTLQAMQQVTDALLRSGASIGQLNALRKHLDRLKGGGLAMAAAPARVVALVISDVPGDDLATVASGPTLGDGTTFVDAQEVLSHLDAVPPQVAAFIDAGVRGAQPPNPRPGSPDLCVVATSCVASNAAARAAATAAALGAGYQVVAMPPLVGEARETGLALGRRLSAQAPGIVAIAGGETTVTVTGFGRGGRNQELALAAVPVMLGLDDALLATLATDGEDGPTDAAGAVVRGNTLPRALERGLDPLEALKNNDAYPFFDALDDLIRPGPTGTNVCDLAFALTRKA